MELTALDVPEWFSQSVLQQAQQRPVPRADILDIEAIQAQLAWSHDARELYLQTRLYTMPARYIGLFSVTQGPATFVSLWHSAQRDPHGFFFDILSRGLIHYEDHWMVYALHPSIRESHLPSTHPYVGLGRLMDRPHRLSQLVFTETIIHSTMEGTRNTRVEWRLLWIQTNFHGSVLLQTLHQVWACDEALCSLSHNGLSVSIDEQHRVNNGDFLQLTIDESPEEMRQKTRRFTLPISDTDPPVAAEASSSSGTTPGRPANTTQPQLPLPPGLGMQFGGWIFMLIWTCSSSRLPEKRLSAAPCPRDRWCAGLVFPSLGASSRLWSCLCFIFVWSTSFLWVQTLAIQLPTSGRVGEAAHPGPPIYIGTTNPSGLRGKTFQYKELPEGVWGISETHLSAHSMRSIGNQMRAASHTAGSSRFFLPGAPIPLRARSNTEGGWSGVATLTDLPPREIKVHWPAEEYSLGRAQMAQYWCGGFPLTGINVYLWPKSPTWPKALEASRMLLETVTRELIFSRAGPRFVTGDLNHREDQLPVLEQWKAQGWIEIQDLAMRRFGRQPVPTYRDSTAPDQVWISPELAARFVSCDTWSLFADHVVLGAKFELPLQQLRQSSWVLPAEIPWAQLNMEAWHRTTQPPQIQCDQSVSSQYRSFWLQYEQSFSGVLHTPDGTLPAGHCGRAQRTSPDQREAQGPLLRPSRPGEVQLATDLVGRSVQAWFKQLRRLQSLLHSLRAGKLTGEAQIYRAALWRSIKRSQGFSPSFREWWPHWPIRLQGSPQLLSTHVPTTVAMEAIWEDFHCNFRKFEAWHVRRRKELLTAHLEADHNRLYHQVKPPSKHALTHLQETQFANVIGVSDDGQTIQVDTSLPDTPTVEYSIDGRPANFDFESSDVIRIDYDGLCEVGSEVEATEHYATFQAIDAKLRTFWEKRWIKSQPSEADWTRILAFAAAYLPVQTPCSMPIDVESWTEINKRYTNRSARGPDGVSRKDLQCMPQPYKDELVSLLQRMEMVSTWPDSLTTGFVYPLPKRSSSVGAGDYRPVIIYSMVYRSWSSHRARRLLRHLHHLAGSRQFGFMPDTDASEMWLMAQALIEASSLQDIPLHGYVTDIQKAFENLPRDPIKQIAERMGAPKPILDLWFAFLTSMKRRFVIAGQIGEEAGSNHGFPEGCGLSCFAMSLVDISFHAYFHAYSQRTIELSFVDNLELMAFTEQQLQAGIICLQTWLELWDLHLDPDKSYVWSTSPATRASLQVLGWRISQVDKDLGAPMAYGKRSATSVASTRVQSLRPLWPMLLRSLAPQWQKEKLLRTALWPRAFYGGAISTLAQDHLRQLRTEAMRALGFRRAGASPAIRLFLLCHEQCDPGYYDAWHSLLTFRRVAEKRPALLDLWQDFMLSYAGRPSHGPFAKLLQIFGQVSWHMEPPWVRTHDRILLDLLTVPTAILHDHFQDAWTQQLAITLSKRKDFGVMQGIDRHVLQQGLRRAPSYQHGSLKCLHLTSP